MLVEDVRKLPPFEAWLYWIRERQAIYDRRAAGQPKPWTDDVVMQQVYFTNVYRELDKTTVWLRENVREPLHYSTAVAFAVIAFRWFNRIETGELLLEHDLLTDWDPNAATGYLGKRQQDGLRLFTGAYIINSPAGEGKLDATIRRISQVWKDREALEEQVQEWTTLRGACLDLQRYDGIGEFMSYEVVTDLRHTAWLEGATDIMTWANPGPGAVRGMYRLMGWPIETSNSARPPVPENWDALMIDLLERTLKAGIPVPPGLAFEMHEVEMCLCEVDKYLRVLHGDGRSKRSYPGGKW